jgi:hypothetical protein
MRFTEHNETPANRATSVFEWPAFNKNSTSYRFPACLTSSFLHLPAYRLGRHRGEFLPLTLSWMAQNFRNLHAGLY